MSSSWATIENGIRAWVEAGSGLAPGKVIWAKGAGPRPAAPYIALSATVRTVGRPWVDVRDADSPVNGAEIVRTSRSVKKLSLQIQCFDGDASGDSSSVALVNNVTDYAGLPSQKAAFVAAGWAPSVFESTLDFSGVRGGAKFEPRSVMLCHGYITGEISETGTYIELASVENLVDGSQFDAGIALHVFGIALISCSADVTAYGMLVVLDQDADASITGTASVGSAGVIGYPGVASISATVSLSSSGVIDYAGLAAMTATAALSSAAVIDYAALASIMASATVTAAGTFATGAAAVLADFDFRTPLTSWKTGFTGFTSPVAEHQWTLQSYSAGYADSGTVGGETLSSTGGGITDQPAIGIFDGTDFISRKAWECTDTNDGLDGSSTTVLDSNNEDLTVRIAFRWASTSTGARTLISKTAGAVASTAGWSIYSNAVTGIGCRVHDGTNSVALTLGSGGEHQDGGWHYAEMHYDDSAEMLYLRSDLGTTVSASTSAVTGSLTNAGEVYIGDPKSGITNGRWQCCYGGGAVGSAAATMYAEDFWQHAQDPSGLLTTQTRASAIGLKVAGGYTALYGVDQFAMGYQSLFTDTSKYAGFFNAATTNLITYSEALTNWTGSGTTSVVDNNVNGPAGFKNASKITAGATNDFIKETVTTVASTNYTFRAEVLEATVGCTGRLIVYDETGVAELASQTFTCTSTWQTVSVTAVTNGGQVSTSLRIEIDTSGEELYASECQFNLALGDGETLGAMIRTSGSTAVLSVPSMIANSAAGLLMQNDFGEVEVVSVGASIGSSANRYMFEGRAASGNGSKTSGYMSFDSNEPKPRMLWYDGAGALQGSLLTLAGWPTTLVEMKSLFRWDKDGLLATGGGADGSASYNGGTGEKTDIGTYTSADNVVNVFIGHTGVATSPFDGWIQRVRIWDKEGGA